MLLLYTLIGRVEPTCTHTFTEMNQRINLKILTHNFVAIPEFIQI